MMSNQKFVELNELFISRDDEGAVLPIEVQSPMFGKAVSIVPMTYGYMKSMGLDMKIPAIDWPIDQKLDMCKAHIMSPDLSSLTVKDATERMGPMTLNHLVSLVVAYSVPMTLRQKPAIDALTERMKGVLLENDMRKASTSSIDSDINIPEEVVSTG